MISCNDAVRQLWEYLDGVIGEGEREAIEQHLALCRRCCGAVEFAEELSRFLARHADDELPGPVRDRLTSVIEELGR